LPPPIYNAVPGLLLRSGLVFIGLVFKLDVLVIASKLLI